MDQNIKQRLVGIAVIFALAVIFLPMILDGSGLEKKTLKVEIPDQPVIEPRADFNQKIIELQAKVDEMPNLEPRFVDEKTVETKNRITRQLEKKPETALKKAESEPKTVKQEAKLQSGGDSWVLQVGSFKDREKALSQRNRLRKANIAAVFIEQFNVDNQASYRVRLGPFLKHEQSKIAQNKIKAKYSIDGLIMKYER